MTRGACVCGLVSFEIEPPWHWFSFCHCSICRRHHGSLFSASIGVDATRLRWTAGAEAIRHYRYSAAFERPFCARCGSKLPGPSGVHGRINVPAGLLEDAFDVAPRTHIFVGSKSAAFTISDDLLQYDTWPPGIAGTLSCAASPAEPRPANDSGTRSGGCLCGAVRYRSGASVERVFHCHCSRCRRSSGAPFATHAVLATAAVEWTTGKECVSHWPMPQARFFATAFCERCGSLLPVPVTRLDRVYLPFGSLDDPSGLVPRAHIHVGSKARWFEISDALPRYEAAPPAPPR
jgi:hypothetical protein